MAERRENSVLFSLKELRRIEDDRLKKEQDETQARLEAERAAREAQERATREAEEQRRRDEEDRVRRIEEEREAKIREEQLRLQETERRARIEVEGRLQEERMRLEMQARVQSRSPIKAVIGVAGVLVLVAGILGYKMYAQHQQELATLAAQRDEAAREAKARELELQNKIAAIQKDTSEKLALAKTEEERQRIRADAARAQALAQSASKSGHKSTGKDGATPATPVTHTPIKKHTISDNPLEGL